MIRLPELRLEVYLGRWELRAPHHLTASDAETLTVAELLALGSEEDRAAFDALALRYVTPGEPARCGRRWLPPTSAADPRTCSASAGPRRPCSGPYRSWSDRASTPW